MPIIEAFNTVERRSMPVKENKYLIDGLGIGQQLHGNIRVGNKGAGSVLIDGQNNRIIINDGTYDRILIGYQEGGF